MNIIIIGAGKVGFTVAEVLSHNNDVMIVENDTQVAERVKSLLNVSMFNENGSNPKILREAIERHRADVVIATTKQDDVNLFICMLAKQIDPDVKTVARVVDPDYVPGDKGHFEGIDQIFSPELLSASLLATIATLENAVDYESIESMGMGLATFLVTRSNPDIIGKVVIGLDIPPDVGVVAIYRGDEVILDNETVEIHEGDRICVLGTPEGIDAFNTMMGCPREANEFVILGATVTGAHTARLLQGKKRYVKLIEPDTEVCRHMARQFSSVIVVNGSPVDPHLLNMENVGRSDVVLALSSSDETNLLACLMGKKLGARKIVASYSLTEYEDIFDFTGIQSTLGYHRVVANEITKTLVSDSEAILRMKYDGELFFSIDVMEESSVASQLMGDVKLPSGSRVACILREDRRIFPRMDVQYLPGDKVLMFTYNVKISKLEKLFRSQINHGVTDAQ